MFNKLHKLTVSIDPFTYLAIDHLAKISGMTLEDYAANILTNNSPVYTIAEESFKVWVKKEEDLCTKDDE